jgi:hypothetical protein
VRSEARSFYVETRRSFISGSDAPSPAQTLSTEPSNCGAAPTNSVPVSAVPAPTERVDEYLVKAFSTLLSTFGVVAHFRRYIGYKQSSRRRLAAGRKPNSQFSSDALSLPLRALSLNPNVHDVHLSYLEMSVRGQSHHPPALYIFCLL